MRGQMNLIAPGLSYYTVHISQGYPRSWKYLNAAGSIFDHFPYRIGAVKNIGFLTAG